MSSLTDNADMEQFPYLNKGNKEVIEMNNALVIISNCSLDFFLET